MLGLCDCRPSANQVEALIGAGIDPFGIETVALARRSEAEAAALLAGAVAKLARLAPGESGRLAADAGQLSRRALLMLRAPATRDPVAIIDPAVCVGSRRCGNCARDCPEEAIDLSGSHPAVRGGACTACGRCVTACPVQAIHLSGAAPAQIEAQLEVLLTVFERIVLACRSARARAPAGWGLVELPTLSVLTPGWLLGLRARGVEIRLAGCGGACCARAAGVLALSERVELSATYVAMTAPLALREPRATVRALAGAADPRLCVESEVSPLGLLDLDPDCCTLCGACTAACPTGAIVRGDSGADASLVHDARSCTGCGLCVRACPEGALTLRLGLDAERLSAGPVTVMTAATGACTRCGQRLEPLPLRRRVDRLLGGSGEPAQLCAACSARGAPAPSLQ